MLGALVVMVLFFVQAATYWTLVRPLRLEAPARLHETETDERYAA